MFNKLESLSLGYYLFSGIRFQMTSSHSDPNLDSIESNRMKTVKYALITGVLYHGFLVAFSFNVVAIGRVPASIYLWYVFLCAILFMMLCILPLQRSWLGTYIAIMSVHHSISMAMTIALGMSFNIGWGFIGCGFHLSAISISAWILYMSYKNVN